MKLGCRFAKVSLAISSDANELREEQRHIRFPQCPKPVSWPQKGRNEVLVAAVAIEGEEEGANVQRGKNTATRVMGNLA